MFGAVRGVDLYENGELNKHNILHGKGTILKSNQVLFLKRREPEACP